MTLDLDTRRTDDPCRMLRALDDQEPETTARQVLRCLYEGRSAFLVPIAPIRLSTTIPRTAKAPYPYWSGPLWVVGDTRD